MKSAERHQLETNWLAIHLDRWLEKARPYTSTIVGVLTALVLLFAGWLYLHQTSSSHEQEAWNSFDNVVSSTLDSSSVTQLGKTAEEFADTDMQPLARVTWADGQVWIASRTILQDRAAATKALDDAAGAYRSVISSSRDEPLVDRAHFGLARVFEMRNEPDKAREEYAQVTGAFSAIAKQRAEQLKDEKTRQTLAWLAKADAPRFTLPSGAGTPGQTPGLDVDDLKLPGADSLVDPTKPQMKIEDLFKGLGDLGKNADESSKRYEQGDAAKTGAERGQETDPKEPAGPTEGATPNAQSGPNSDAMKSGEPAKTDGEAKAEDSKQAAPPAAGESPKGSDANTTGAENK